MKPSAEVGEGSLEDIEIEVSACRVKKKGLPQLSTLSKQRRGEFDIMMK
jgi:hypothetical protein